jgi:hypothetical protein
MPSYVIDDVASRRWEEALDCGLFLLGRRGLDENTAGTNTARGAGLRRRFCWGSADGQLIFGTASGALPSACRAG